MTDEFNILDRKNIQYIDSLSDAVSIDGIDTETELGRFIVPAKFVHNGVIINVTAFWSFIHGSGSDIFLTKAYIKSITAGNEIVSRSYSLAQDGWLGMGKDLYIQDSNIISSADDALTNDFRDTDPLTISITQNVDLPIIFTGAVLFGTSGDIETLHGYHGKVIY